MRNRSTDPGYGRFARRVRQLRPKLAEREIGLAWMRAETSRAGQGEIPIAPPEDFAIDDKRPTVTVHLLYDDGSTLNSAVLIDSIPQMLALIDEAHFSRTDIRDFIDEMFLLQRHVERDIAACIVGAALWNALRGGVAPALQAFIDTGRCRLVYLISHHAPGGIKMVNFRLVAGDVRQGLPALLDMQSAVPLGVPNAPSR